MSSHMAKFYNLLSWICLGLKEMVSFHWFPSISIWLQPYLHESRHRHALKRVRGSGGRFLSAKQLQQSNAEHVTDGHSGPDPVNIYQKNDALEVESHPSGTGENASMSAISGLTISGTSVNFRQPEHNFLGNSPSVGGSSQCSGGLAFGSGARQCASVGRWEAEPEPVQIKFTCLANHPWLSHFTFCVSCATEMLSFGRLWMH